MALACQVGVCFLSVLFVRMFDNCLPQKVVVEQRKEIQDGSIFSGHVERHAPLDKADGVRILAVGNDEANASFGQFVKGFWVRVGLVASSLLKKIVEAPA